VNFVSAPHVHGLFFTLSLISAFAFFLHFAFLPSKKIKECKIDPTLVFEVIVGRHKIPKMLLLGNNREHLIAHGQLNIPQNKNPSHT